MDVPQLKIACSYFIFRISWSGWPQSTEWQQQVISLCDLSIRTGTGTGERMKIQTGTGLCCRMTRGFEWPLDFVCALNFGFCGEPERLDIRDQHQRPKFKGQRQTNSLPPRVSDGLP